VLDQLTTSDFDSLPDRRIMLMSGDRRIPLEVKEVRALPERMTRAVAPFTLTLRDPGAKTSFAQGMFRFEHPTRGVLDLFTVPIGPDGVGMCYEIIFN
jgi:hypothetical protein